MVAGNLCHCLSGGVCCIETLLTVKQALKQVLRKGFCRVYALLLVSYKFYTSFKKRFL